MILSQKLSTMRIASSTAATGTWRKDAMVEHSPPITTLLVGVGVVLLFMAPHTGQQFTVLKNYHQ